jgi:hypothetical protein
VKLRGNTSKEMAQKMKRKESLDFEPNGNGKVSKMDRWKRYRVGSPC